MRTLSTGLTVLLVLAACGLFGNRFSAVNAHGSPSDEASRTGAISAGQPDDGDAAPSPAGTSVVFTINTVEPSPSGSGDVYSISTAEPVASTAPAPSSQPTADSTASGVLAYGARVDGQWDIYTTDVETTESVQLTSEPGDEWAPAWSPDGSRIAYLSGQSGSSQVWVMNRDGSDQHQVSRWSGPGEVYYAAWLPDDSRLIVTVADNAAGVARLISQPLDGSAPSDYTEPWSGVASFSDTGEMAYTVRSNGQTDIVLDDGSAQYITASGINEDIPSISHDATKIVYQVGDPGSRSVEIYHLTTATAEQLPRIGDDSNPVWSPGDDRIAFVSEDGARAEIYLAREDGSGVTMLPIVAHDTVWYLSWSA